MSVYDRPGPVFIDMVIKCQKCQTAVCKLLSSQNLFFFFFNLSLEVNLSNHIILMKYFKIMLCIIIETVSAQVRGLSETEKKYLFMYRKNKSIPPPPTLKIIYFFSSHFNAILIGMKGKRKLCFSVRIVGWYFKRKFGRFMCGIGRDHLLIWWQLKEAQTMNLVLVQFLFMAEDIF